MSSPVPTPPHEPADADFESRVRTSLTRQRFMTALGVSIVSVEPGAVTLRLPFSAELTQQHGYVHAGAIAAVLDSACGYAAFSLMAVGQSVLTVEYKINLVAPAEGAEFLARATVMRRGKTLTVCSGTAVARAGDRETVIALMQSTIMALPDRAGRTA